MLKAGDAWSRRHEYRDSALMCYSIVAHRYRPDMSRETAREVFEGYYRRWRVLYFSYNLHDAIPEDIHRMILIDSLWHIDSQRVHYAMGMLYVSRMRRINPVYNMRKARQHLAMAVADAGPETDAELFHQSFMTLSHMAYVIQKDPDGFPGAERLLLRHHCSDHLADSICRHFHLGNVAYARYNMTAMKWHHEMALNLMISDNFGPMWKARLYLDKFRHARITNDNDAVRFIDSVISLSYIHNLPQERYEALVTVSDSLRLNTYKGINLFDWQTSLFDTITSDQFIKDLDLNEYVELNNRISHDLDAANDKSRIIKRALTISVTVLIVIIICLYVTYIWNSRLRHDRNRLAEHLNAQEISLTLNSTDSTQQTSDCQTALAPIVNTQYEAKSECGRRLLEIINNSETIYKADFDLQKLADIAGESRARVSAVINSECECGFSELVNRARIKEALKRMDNTQEYGALSVEGLGMSVGFGSRKSFARWFHEVTGMNPNEYRQARENKV